MMQGPSAGHKSAPARALYGSINNDVGPVVESPRSTGTPASDSKTTQHHAK